MGFSWLITAQIALDFAPPHYIILISGDRDFQVRSISLNLQQRNKKKRQTVPGDDKRIDRS
jgi:hypothetical protein